MTNVTDEELAELDRQYGSGPVTDDQTQATQAVVDEGAANHG